ncbi:hypothetical protein DFQ28_007917 [Apophysomyces sp. BC1034]|nr:hypothetical protein DFQ30_007650 [Apophysomyces sp. BC1015]KAG0176048.1 hypothetical protein DFQ29_006632 [Apophysomyces sp. BC1021]KAG0186401.1 hypothetical protein DFQ28_007917 [Apophysomyces sp. BC1034]
MSCPNLPINSVRCWTCSQLGHVSANCTRVLETALGSSNSKVDDQHHTITNEQIPKDDALPSVHLEEEIETEVNEEDFYDGPIDDLDMKSVTSEEAALENIRDDNTNGEKDRHAMELEETLLSSLEHDPIPVQEYQYSRKGRLIKPPKYHDQ